MKQYHIVLVGLDPTLGSEMKKTRPCVIISPDEMNRYLQTIIIAPITGSSKPYPTRIEIKNQKTKGWIVIDQIRIIAKERVKKQLGALTEREINSVKNTIRETLVN